MPESEWMDQVTQLILPFIDKTNETAGGVNKGEDEIAVKVWNQVKPLLDHANPEILATAQENDLSNTQSAQTIRSTITLLLEQNEKLADTLRNLVQEHQTATLKNKNVQGSKNVVADSTIYAQRDSKIGDELNVYNHGQVGKQVIIEKHEGDINL